MHGFANYKIICKAYIANSPLANYSGVDLQANICMINWSKKERAIVLCFDEIDSKKQREVAVEMI